MNFKARKAIGEPTIDDELRESEELIRIQEVRREQRQREVVKSARRNVQNIKREMTDLDKDLRNLSK